MKNILPYNRQCQSRSLLNDYKNKPQNRQLFTKINNQHPQQTQPNNKHQISPSRKQRNNSLSTHPPHPHNTLALNTHPLTSNPQEPFSKSEEETKAEQESISEISTRQSSSWEGILGEYKDDIMQYVQAREAEYKIEGSYLHHSHILSAKFRNYLVRYIFKQYDRWNLLRNTLHLAVFYLDIYFSKNPFLKDQMEGVSTAQACLLIAMKYEEIYPPDMKEWVDRRQKEDVIKLEAKILTCLNYQLSHFTVQHYLRLLAWQKGEDDDDNQSLGNFLADLSLFDLNIRQISGSKVAAAIQAFAKGAQPPDHKVGLSVKWMIERNSESLHWLKHQKYYNLGDIDLS